MPRITQDSSEVRTTKEKTPIKVAAGKAGAAARKAKQEAALAEKAEAVKKLAKLQTFKKFIAPDPDPDPQVFEPPELAAVPLP